MRSCASLALAGVLVVLAGPLAAMENVRNIAAVSLAAKQQNTAPMMPWFSALQVIGTEVRSVYLADGRKVMQRPDRVTSYSADRSWDVAHFYKPDSMRISAIMHWAGRTAGEVFSFGMDSGYRAEKMTIAPALFVGYARSLNVGKASYFTFAAGGWLGGKVSHKACYDSFDREYYCADLTAWSDFRAPEDQLRHYYQLVFTHEF